MLTKISATGPTTVRPFLSNPAAKFVAEHGPCAPSMAWRVVDAKHAFDHAVKNGAEPYTGDDKVLDVPAIKGIGGSLLYFVEKYGTKGSVYTNDDFTWLGPVDPKPEGVGFYYLDHLTHNVFRGNMDKWSNFYIKLFNFRQIRFFDIEGKMTGLFSRALTSPCGRIRIPINESADDHSQIEEYLRKYKGEGIQHGHPAARRRNRGSARPPRSRSSRSCTPMSSRRWGASGCRNCACTPTSCPSRPTRSAVPRASASWRAPDRPRPRAAARRGQSGGRAPARHRVVPAIAAAAVAFELAVREQAEYAARTARLCSSLWQQLSNCIPGIQLNGPAFDAPRLPNTLNVTLPGVESRTLVARLDLEGLEVSAGSACASGSLEPSHVLLALGHGSDGARAALRLSLGRTSGEEDVHNAVEILRRTISAAR